MWVEIDKADMVNVNKHLDIFNNMKCITEEIGYIEPITIETLKATMRKEDCHMYYYENDDRRCISVHKYNARFDADVVFQWWDTLPAHLYFIKNEETWQIHIDHILIILNNHGHRAVRRSKWPEYLTKEQGFKDMVGQTRENQVAQIVRRYNEAGIKLTELENQWEHELM